MGYTLLVSKIDSIKIIQVGDSVLSSKNKKQESSKVGFTKKKDKTEKHGTNTTVDLGKGAEKHTLKFFVFNKDENEAIFDIVRKKRYCTITDKFKGKIKVYIDDYKIIDSDKHINKTIYEINCTVQDIESKFVENFTAQLKSVLEQIEKDFEAMVEDLGASGLIDTVSTITDIATGTEKFANSILDTIQDGIMKILDFQSDMLDAYNGVKKRIDRAKRLVETIKNIVNFPKDFISLCKDLTGENIMGNVEIFEAYIGDKTLSQIADGVDALTTNEEQNEVATSTRVTSKDLEEAGLISQTQQQEIEKIEIGQKIVNTIATMMEIKQAFNKEFASQEEFENHINILLERIEKLDYCYEDIVYKKKIVKAYAGQQKYKEIVIHNVKTPTPLVKVVYELYGDLDNYDFIEKLNGFKDNDRVYGDIKVYASSN